MEMIFFKNNEEFENVAKNIFTTLGISNYSEGESSNVLGGIYYAFTIFGIQIKLEQNSYDYEELFNFMLTINKDRFSDPSIGNIEILSITEIIIKRLTKKGKMQIAREVNEVLKYYK